MSALLSDPQNTTHDIDLCYDGIIPRADHTVDVIRPPVGVEVNWVDLLDLINQEQEELLKGGNNSLILASCLIDPA